MSEKVRRLGGGYFREAAIDPKEILKRLDALQPEFDRAVDVHCCAALGKLRRDLGRCTRPRPIYASGRQRPLAKRRCAISSAALVLTLGPNGNGRRRDESPPDRSRVGDAELC